MANSRTLRFLRYCEIGFWAVGLSLLLVWAAVRASGEVGRVQGVAEFEQALAHSAASGVGTSAGISVGWAHAVSANPRPDQTMWSKSRVSAYRESLSANASLPAGLLQIPKINLKVPIYDEVSEINLNRGVARIAGTARMGEAGNTGIAGHRDGYFRGLKDVVVGDLIELTTIGGVSRFKISSIEIVDPSDVWVLDPTANSAVTLVTCYPFYFIGHAPKRYIVTANAIERLLLE